MDIKNKVVALTGAGSGIGQALARELANQGCHLALADINVEALKQTVSFLTQYDIIVSKHKVDVSNKEQVHHFADAVVAQHGHVDMLINNAGVALMESVEDVTYDDLEWIMGINFWGVVYGTKAFLPYLRQRPWGHIANVSSIAGLVGLPVQAAYSSTKFAVRGFTESLRLELAGSNITTSCTHPGGVKTNIVRNARYYKNPDKQEEVADQAACAARFESTLAPTTTEQAAKKIVKGIKKSKSKILIGWDARLIDFISRFLPSLHPKMVALYAKHSK